MVKRKIKMFWGTGLLASILACGFICAYGQETKFRAAEWGIKLRALEGLKEGASESAKVVTSSYLKYTLSANFQSNEELAAEKNQIKKIFNLKDVKLLTEADLNWKEQGPDKVSHIFRLDGKTYMVQVSGGNVASAPDYRIGQRFGIEVFEQNEREKVSLLDTEFTLPNLMNVAIFGFEDTQGRPYFISLRMTRMSGVEGGVVGGVVGGIEGGVSGGVSKGVTGGVVGGVIGGVEGGVGGKEQEEFEKGAVRCVGQVQPPKLVKKVNPVYPEIARKAGVEGVVILEAKTDIYGRVQKAKILRSVPLLDQAAIDAVKQWVYEPLMIEGVPRSAIFTVTVKFKLDGEKAGRSAQAIEEFAKDAVKVEGEVKPPKLIKIIEPVYPEVARAAGVEGVVIVQARTDVSGKVKDVMVLRPVPLLEQAAIDAVKQWVYEPLTIKGKPMEAVFTVTVRFDLKEKEKKSELDEASELEKGAVRATGEINPPNLIKKVNPVYPEEARKAGIEGIVILEAMTDQKGNIVRVKVLQSIPELDQAAVDALKQWKYEPVVIDGKPRSIVFTVTVRFQLK